MPFVLGLKIEDNTPIKDRGHKKWLRDITKETLHDTGEEWHIVIFLKHFAGNARFVYHFEKRTEEYEKEIKPEQGQGAGKTDMLQLSGKSRRFMLAFVKITGTSKSATVTMKPPFYFANPFIGSFTDEKTGETKTVTRQPDKVNEATKTVNADLRHLQRFAEARAHKLMNKTLPTKTTIIK